MRRLAWCTKLDRLSFYQRDKLVKVVAALLLIPQDCTRTKSTFVLLKSGFYPHSRMTSIFSTSPSCQSVDLKAILRNQYLTESVASRCVKRPKQLAERFYSQRMLNLIFELAFTDHPQSLADKSHYREYLCG
uniref:AlNc14C103G6135 protein n=1 Tax=Albugo laibachii Nc14 TaxID=890382 RepID=F0WHS8_9STRA|nr:AlNc14C103G6135 [Albugo laibachii Nc14]|eukprot:CCA20803.1 AlNc14C103G6135 [Albugo laibachii Nc14]